MSLKMLNKRAVQFLFACMMLVASAGYTQNEGSGIFVFNPKYLKSSMRHEIGLSLGTHWVRSPMVAEFIKVRNNIAYPTPVYNRVIGLFAMTYEPKFRLIEFGSAASISLDVPLTLGLSSVDIVTPSGDHYAADEITANDLETGVYSKEREAALGGLHVEGGGLISLNFWQGSTLENTSSLGLSISGGINAIYAPLVMNIIYEYERSDYKGMLAWYTPVARMGLHIKGVVFYYTIGVMPTNVAYQSRSGVSRTAFTNTYNRFSISFRLGK